MRVASALSGASDSTCRIRRSAISNCRWAHAWRARASTSVASGESGCRIGPVINEDSAWGVSGAGYTSGVAGAKKDAGREPGVGDSPRRSKIVGDGEPSTTRRPGVFIPAIVDVRVGGGSERVVVENRRLLVEQVEHRQVEVELVPRPARLVVQVHANIVNPRRRAQRTRRYGLSAAPEVGMRAIQRHLVRPVTTSA